MKALPDLGENFINIFSSMVFFAIIGLHLFSGAFEYRCRQTPEPVDGEWLLAEGIPYMCSTYECPENTFCGAPNDKGIPWDENERDIVEMNFGVTNFDSILWAMLTVFHYVRATGWSSIVFMVIIQ